MRTLTTITILIFCCAVPSVSQEGLPHIKVSADIEIVPLSEHSFVHVSYTDVPGFGRVGSNGVIYVVGREAFLFDTPMNDSLTVQLVEWITDSLKVHIAGFVPNHWHADCMGGLGYLHLIGIPSYANEMTIDIASAKGLPLPQHGFTDSLTLRLGGKAIVCRYHGPAHARDNIVVWLPSEGVLFAGCMAKDMNSGSLGNLSDADLVEWPKTIARVIADYPAARTVVPGHGVPGGVELLKHTLDLLAKSKE